MPINIEWIMDKWNVDSGWMKYTVHIMLYYSAIKGNEVLIHVTILMNLENIMLNEISWQKRTNIWFHLHEIPRIGKFIQIERRIKIKSGHKENRELLFNWWLFVMFSVWKNEKSLWVYSDNGCSTLWIYVMPLNCTL